MISTFITSYRLKNTYRVNTIIYTLKQISIIKILLPVSLYKNQELKIFAHIISIVYEIGFFFLGKILYFLILNILGSFINTRMFSTTQDKYYAVILMKMDERQFVLFQHFYTLFKHCIGYIPCFLYFSLSLDYPPWLCFLLPISYMEIN